MSEQVVQTVEELDALPRGSVIVGSDEAWTKRSAGWSSCFDNHVPYSRADLLPARVIWNPNVGVGVSSGIEKP